MKIIPQDFCWLHQKSPILADLSWQKELDAVPEATQQIECVRHLKIF